MRAVLLSIKPKYCELIASGKKTIEVRKTIPKIERPFKCYIYCTKQGKQFFHGEIGEKECLFKNPDTGKIKFDYAFELMCCKNEYTKDNFLSGKVIGEFVCDRIDDLRYVPTKYYLQPAGTWEEMICNNSCLSVDEIKEYAKGKAIYAWHISDLKIYGKPKDLSEFKHWVNDKDYDGWNDQRTKIVKGFVLRPLTRPPQSWQFVETGE